MKDVSNSIEDVEEGLGRQELDLLEADLVGLADSLVSLLGQPGVREVVREAARAFLQLEQGGRCQEVLGCRSGEALYVH